MFSRTHPSTADDEIVISGVSGKFPSCKNVEEFSYNLYNKVSLKDSLSYIVEFYSIHI